MWLHLLWDAHPLLFPLFFTRSATTSADDSAAPLWMPLEAPHCLKSEIHKMFLNLSRKRYLDPWTLLNVWFRSKLPLRLLMWQANMLISYWYKSNPKEEKETDQPLWLLAQCKSKKEKNILIKISLILTYHHRNLLACMPHFLEFQESIAFASGTRFRRYLKVSVWF